MKRLKLPQPYASMVTAGILQALPNQWEDIQYGEKIFIYADDLAKQFCNGPDYSNAFHQKIFNEMFMGNLPDSDFPTQRFLGYVRVYHKGIIDTEWIKDDQQTIFVGLPHKLMTIIDDFNSDDESLERACARKATLKSIQKNGSNLYVPVCKSIWQRLHNDQECLNVCMFWEDYMAAYTLGCFSLESIDIEEVDEIHFRYNGKTISFITDGGVGEEIVSNFSKNEVVSLLLFNLRYRKDRYTVKELNISEIIEESKLGTYIDKDELEKTASPEKEYRPYIRFISTPMGGMTRWKR